MSQTGHFSSEGVRAFVFFVPITSVTAQVKCYTIAFMLCIRDNSVNMVDEVPGEKKPSEDHNTKLAFLDNWLNVPCVLEQKLGLCVSKRTLKQSQSHC